jgi:hypothetical protein
MANPEIHAQAMAKRSQNTEYRKYLSERMRGDRNPAQRPEVREAIKAAWVNSDRVPYGNTGKWGKGRGKTESEQLAFAALHPLGFIPEFKVLTGIPKGRGNATWYSLDLAHPQQKIAIEIDGSSHANRREVDAQKDDWLLRNGWLVFRIPSRYIREGLAWVQLQLPELKISRLQVHQFTIWK